MNVIILLLLLFVFTFLCFPFLHTLKTVFARTTELYPSHATDDHK